MRPQNTTLHSLVAHSMLLFAIVGALSYWPPLAKHQVEITRLVRFVHLVIFERRPKCAFIMGPLLYLGFVLLNIIQLSIINPKFGFMYSPGNTPFCHHLAVKFHQGCTLLVVNPEDAQNVPVITVLGQKNCVSSCRSTLKPSNWVISPIWSSSIFDFPYIYTWLKSTKPSSRSKLIFWVAS